MASIRNLKKDLNAIMGEIIELIYEKELENTSIDAAKSEALIDEVIAAFDDFIAKIHTKDVDNKHTHFKQLNLELEATAQALLNKVEKLA